MIRKSILVLALTLTSMVPVTTAQANEAIYLKVAASTALIERPGAFGTGFLIDVKNRLMVTARHVVAKGAGVHSTVDVTFAKIVNGKVVTSAKAYMGQTGKIEARVIYENAARDMAILQLATLPPGAVALPLATETPAPGQEVHVVGNSTINFGALFAYCHGKVRNIFVYDPPTSPILAEVVSHQTPTNKGDSGGAVVNDKGEVVAFISEGTVGSPAPAGHPFHMVQVTDHSISINEIRAGLKDLQIRMFASR